MTVELKPCPFCGAGEATDSNNASFSGVELMAGGTDRPYVWCGTCCASARMADTEAEAIAAWNTRTAPDPVLSDPRVKALVELLREALRLYSCDDGCNDCPEQERDRVSCGWTARAALAEIKGESQ